MQALSLRCGFLQPATSGWLHLHPPHTHTHTHGTLNSARVCVRVSNAASAEVERRMRQGNVGQTEVTNQSCLCAYVRMYMYISMQHIPHTHTRPTKAYIRRVRFAYVVSFCPPVIQLFNSTLAVNSLLNVPAMLN